VNTAAVWIALLLSAVFATAAPVTQAAAPAKPTASPSSKPTPALSKFQAQQREKYNASAPADRYFGRMKMSFLGINNTFRDAAIASGEHTTDQTIANKVALADEALVDWSSKFPHDPQLARTYFLAIDIDKRIWLKENQEKAWTYMNRIVAVFPDSFFAKAIKKNLAVGFTEHYYY
jgi:hypothetical protein